MSSGSRPPLVTLSVIDTVHIWLVGTDQPESVIAELESLLDGDERRRAGALRCPRRRRRFIVAHAAVRVIVGGCLAAPPAQLRWRRGRHGKPELTGAWTGGHANLSHSGALAMVAVCERRPVGVDIQLARPGPAPDRLAARYYPEPEAGFVAAGGRPADRADRFVRLWARKEACVKAAGGRLAEGLCLPVSGDLVRDPTGALPGPIRVCDVPVPPGYRAAVALTGPRPFRTVRHSHRALG